MSLSCLYEHTPAQEQAINQASSGFKPASTCSWGSFRDSLWGRAIESFQGVKRVERDRFDFVGDVTLPDKHVVATLPGTLPKALVPKSKKILVRSEYSEAEQAAVLLSESDLDALMVSGQPGIGKSVFLLWLLMRRLALKLPTALQIHSSYAILFHEGGVSEFAHAEIHPDYRSLMVLSKRPSRRIWALVDTNANLPEPASIFKHASPFFVVDAVPHRSDRLRWINKIGHDYFYMKPWSDLEVLQARPFFDKTYTESQLWYLHKEFGASPRDLVRYARAPGAYKSLLTREITSGEDNSFFHHVIIVGPSQDSRGYFEEKFASRPVFDLLWDISLKHRTDKMAHLYGVLQAGLRITMPVAAGWIFESRIHQLLTRRKTIQLFPILGRRVGENLTYDGYTASGRQGRSMSLQLAESEQHLLPEGGALEEGRYYRPESADFPGIDSLLLVRPPGELLSTLFMFRIAWDQDEHGVNADSLRKINDLELPSNARRCYVMVTPEDISPKVAVSKEQFWSERRRLLTDAFPVFHYPARRLFED